MKLEISLADLDTPAGIRGGCRALLLLMEMLPENEVEHVMRKWLQANGAIEPEAPARPAPSPFPAPPPSPQPPPPPMPHQPPATEQTKPEPEPDRVAAMFARVAASVPSPSNPAGEIVSRETSQQIYGQAPYERFRYNDRDFAVRKRGPTAARDQAFADLLSVTTRAELDQMAHKITGLAGVFREIERNDLAELVLEALRRRQDDLGPAEETAPETTQTAVQNLSVVHTSPIEVEPTPAPAVVEIPLPELEADDVTANTPVEWDGKWVRPMIARTVCLRQIARCTTVAELDHITDQAERLAEKLDELGLAFSLEITKALEARMIAVAPKSYLKPVAQPSAVAANGADQEPLRELLRKVEHELGMRFAQSLLKKYNAVKITDLTPEGEVGIRQEAERELAIASE